MASILRVLMVPLLLLLREILILRHGVPGHQFSFLCGAAIFVTMMYSDRNRHRVFHVISKYLMSCHNITKHGLGHEVFVSVFRRSVRYHSLNDSGRE